MTKDFVPMKLVPGERIIPLELGQMVPVFIEGAGKVRMNPDDDPGDNEMKVMMKVIKTYPNGDFDGEVDWEEV